MIFETVCIYIRAVMLKGMGPGSPAPTTTYFYLQLADDCEL